MNFQHYDLGQRRGGEVVKINLRGASVNAQLLDSSALSSYRGGRSYRPTAGGHVTRSPATFVIPRTGRWHVVIDRGGYPGRWKSSVQILPGALPPAREVFRSTPVISSTAGEPADDMLAVEPPSLTRRWDVFICHATEDKTSVVRPLYGELVALDVDTWYDESELVMGDSIRRKIDHGLANSRFGVVVLSRAFFAREWPQRELDGLVTLETAGRQRILPIWHNISRDEITSYSPTLADKVAARTADATIAEIALAIAVKVGRAPAEDENAVPSA